MPRTREEREAVVVLELPNSRSTEPRRYRSRHALVKALQYSFRRLYYADVPHRPRIDFPPPIVDFLRRNLCNSQNIDQFPYGGAANRVIADGFSFTVCARPLSRFFLARRADRHHLPLVTLDSTVQANLEQQDRSVPRLVDSAQLRLRHPSLLAPCGFIPRTGRAHAVVPQDDDGPRAAAGGRHDLLQRERLVASVPASWRTSRPRQSKTLP